MGFKSDSKDYFEAQLQQRVLYIPNLSKFLDNLHNQILKLPHELQDPSQNDPTGTKYKDIVTSFCNGVDVAYAIISPYRKMGEKEKVFTPPNEEQDEFKLALAKLAWIYDFLDNMDMLNERSISIILPAEEDSYDPNLEAKNGMPTPEKGEQGLAVGPVAQKDKQPVDKESPAPSA